MAGLNTEGIDIERIADPELQDPILMEGLPGVGHVGKLAIEHLLEESESTRICRMISEHFPPLVSVDAASTASLPAVEMHHLRVDGNDLLALVGDHQTVTPMGHYRLTTAVLDVAETFEVDRIFALGGMPTGEIPKEPAVVGAVSRAELAEPLMEHGVEFRESEPTGGIVGVSGLLLGLGGERAHDVSCLMGETSGYLVDPRSAKAVLEVLEGAVGFSVSYDRLESRAEDMEQMIRRLREMQEASMPGEEDLRYIE